MEQDANPREDMAASLASVGIQVSEEGKARARRLLDDARRRLTPARLNEMRARVGLEPIAE